MSSSTKNGDHVKLITENGLPLNAQSSAGEVVDLSAEDATYSKPVTLFVGVGGDVKIDYANSVDDRGNVVSAFQGIVLKNVPSGTDLTKLVIKVWQTGTTATNIIAEHNNAFVVTE